jgi:hypothetical protein
MNANTTAKDRVILQYDTPVEVKSDAAVFWVVVAFAGVILSALVGMLAWVGAFSEHL